MTTQAQETAKVSNAPVVDRNRRIYLVVRDTTEAHGRVVSAVIVKSSGNKIIDNHAIAFAKQNWTGLPKTTADIPVYYKLISKREGALQPTAKSGICTSIAGSSS